MECILIKCMEMCSTAFLWSRVSQGTPRNLCCRVQHGMKTKKKISSCVTYQNIYYFYSHVFAATFVYKFWTLTIILEVLRKLQQLLLSKAIREKPANKLTLTSCWICSTAIHRQYDDKFLHNCIDQYLEPQTSQVLNSLKNVHILVKGNSIRYG